MEVVGDTFLRIGTRDDPKVLRLNEVKDTVAGHILHNRLAVCHSHPRDHS